MNITQCVNCGTMFKVSDVQLMVADGWAKCSHCDEVFNALENIYELPQENKAEVDKIDLPQENNIHQSQEIMEYPKEDIADDSNVEPEDSDLYHRLKKQIDQKGNSFEFEEIIDSESIFVSDNQYFAKLKLTEDHQEKLPDEQLTIFSPAQAQENINTDSRIGSDEILDSSKGADNAELDQFGINLEMTSQHPNTLSLSNESMLHQLDSELSKPSDIDNLKEGSLKDYDEEIDSLFQDEDVLATSVESVETANELQSKASAEIISEQEEIGIINKQDSVGKKSGVNIDSVKEDSAKFLENSIVENLRKDRDLNIGSLDRVEDVHEPISKDLNEDAKDYNKLETGLEISPDTNISDNTLSDDYTYNPEEEDINEDWLDEIQGHDQSYLSTRLGLFFNSFRNKDHEYIDEINQNKNKSIFHHITNFAILIGTLFLLYQVYDKNEYVSDVLKAQYPFVCSFMNCQIDKDEANNSISTKMPLKIQSLSFELHPDLVDVWNMDLSFINFTPETVSMPRLKISFLSLEKEVLASRIIDLKSYPELITRSESKTFISPKGIVELKVEFRGVHWKEFGYDVELLY